MTVAMAIVFAADCEVMTVKMTAALGVASNEASAATRRSVVIGGNRSTDVASLARTTAREVSELICKSIRNNQISTDCRAPVFPQSTFTHEHEYEVTNTVVLAQNYNKEQLPQDTQHSFHKLPCLHSVLTEDRTGWCLSRV